MKFSISRTAFVLLGWNSDEAGVKSDEAKAAIKSAREKTSTRGKGASHFFDTTPDVAKEIATCISTQAEPLVKSEVSKEKEAGRLLEYTAGLINTRIKKDSEKAAKKAESGTPTEKTPSAQPAAAQ